MTNPYILCREDIQTDTELDAGFPNIIRKAIYGKITR